MRYRIVLAAKITLSLVMAPVCAIAQDLVDLAEKDPNAFVKAVQSEMAGLGYYDGAQDGLLDRATIAAISALCRDTDVLARCQAGPLSPGGADAVVSALNAVKASRAVAELADAASSASGTEAPAAPEEAPATPAPAEEDPATPAMPSDAAPILSSDWSGGTENGLTATPLDAGEKGVTFSVNGVAAGGGWVNVYAGPSISAEPGSTWTFAVTGSFTSEANAGAAHVRMAAYLADGEYISELGEGIPMVGDGLFVFSGVAPELTVTVVPYIQIWYPADTAVSGDQLQVTAASIGR